MKRQAEAPKVFMSTAPVRAGNIRLRIRIRKYESNQLANENAAAAHLSVVESGKVAVILAGAQVGAPVVGLQCQRKKSERL